MENKNVLRVSYNKHSLSITIDKDDLIKVIENRSDGSYSVNKSDELLKSVAFELENYQTSNGKETGFSALEELFDQVIDEVVESGDDVILFVDDFPKD